MAQVISSATELRATMHQIDPDAGYKRVSLVDLSGETNIRYTPLATLFLKAILESDAELSQHVHVRLHNFLQAHTTAEMVTDIIAAQPDIVAMSCQGWNIRQLSATFSTLRQFLPASLIVLGGNHLSNRGERVMRAHPEIDVVVNGEGEFTFRELVAATLRGQDFAHVRGITYRDESGQFVTTPERPRSQSMLEIPSPYALADIDYREFDVALLETNRGCPYACAFCYWGGRIGQKIAKGELDRVRAEIETIGRAGIATLFLCDANYGILPQDVEVAHIIVDTYRRYGAPDEFNVNWAKSNAGRVREILSILEAGGVRTNMTLALQTLSDRALKMAGRPADRGRAQMIELALDKVRDGSDLCCELIFGLPGESLTEFKRNYDELYLKFPLLRIHPLWILPNTDYDRRRAEFEIRTISPDPMSDYEAVISHTHMGVDDLRDGLAFLLTHSILSLLGTARHTLRLLARADGRSVAEILSAFEGFIAGRRDPLSEGFAELFDRIRRASYFERSLRDRKRQLLYESRERTHDLVREFLLEHGVPDDVRSTFEELVRFECLLLPRNDLPGSGLVTEEHDFSFDPLELTRLLARPDSDWRQWLRETVPTRVTIGHLAGMQKLKGRNCDLTGRWNGRVVRTRALAPATC